MSTHSGEVLSIAYSLYRHVGCFETALVDDEGDAAGALHEQAGDAVVDDAACAAGQLDRVRPYCGAVLYYRGRRGVDLVQGV